jgi:hypothetical protein
MRRCLLILASLAPLTAFAVPPDFGQGGVLFSIQYGYGIWGINESKLANEVGQNYAQTFTGDLQNTQTASLTLGYNILGHATLECDFTATGWNIFSADRGGAGMVVGAAYWHPIQIFMEGQQRPFDASIFFGVGYGIAGGGASPDYGMDGLVLETGLKGDYYFSPGFALSIFARWMFLQWGNFYLNYDQRAQPGNTLHTSGSAGTFFTIGGALTFRFII